MREDAILAGLGDDERVLVESFARFAADELRPLADRNADGPVLPTKEILELFRRIDEFGLVTGLAPSEDDGELDLQVYAHLFERLADAWADLAIATLIQSLIASLLQQIASPAQKERYLAPMMRGERIGCVCISEPAVGSNVAAVQTQAIADGDEIVIRGQKLWISNGGWADFAIVVCRDGDALSMVIADRDAGWTSREIQKMGIHAASTAELFFDDVRVPRDNVLGKPGEGLRQTLKLFERARIFVGLTSVGIARAALEAAVGYAQEREQHGKPIGGHQIIQVYVAEMATEIDAARLLCSRALDLLARGQRCDTESSMAKWYATEMAVGVASKAVQIHGGFGLTRDYAVERHFRNARIMPIPDGTTEIQKLLIARNLLGISAFA